MGLLNSKGQTIVEPEYHDIIISDDNKLITLRNLQDEYSVINREGVEIVPPGKYSYIDGFWKGICRVNCTNHPSPTNPLEQFVRHWGIINQERGVILPVEYDRIWNFYGKDRIDTQISKNDISQQYTLPYFNSKK